MRVQFSLGCPSAVDRSVHAIKQLGSTGHTVGVSVRQDRATSSRLDATGIEHTVLTTAAASRLGTAVEAVVGTVRLSRYAQTFEPSVIVGESTPATILASVVSGARLIQWAEPTTESVPEFSTEADSTRYVPAAPALRGAVARFHPNWFSPNRRIRRSHGVDETDGYAVAQFTAKASPYNAPQEGLSRRTKQGTVESLSTQGAVYVSNTDDPHPALDAFRITVPSVETPHLVDGASLFVTDSAELAVSGALCGTPTVYAHTDETDASVPRSVAELAAQKLVRVAVGDHEVQSTVEELVAESSREAVWERRTARFFTATGDPTTSLLNTIYESADRSQSTSTPTRAVDSA